MLNLTAAHHAGYAAFLPTRLALISNLYLFIYLSILVARLLRQMMMVLPVSSHMAGLSTPPSIQLLIIPNLSQYTVYVLQYTPCPHGH